MTGVPIHLILNANPTFVRGEEVRHGLKALARDIEQFGLQQKVLLDRDYQIIDGARRILACQQLGMTEIPAVSTSDWVTIRDHMIATRKVEESLGIAPLPLKWAQLADFYNRIIKPLAFPYERARANATRKVKHREKEPRVGPSRSLTLHEFAEMMGNPVPNSISDVLRIASRIKAIRIEAPEIYESTLDYVKRAELVGESPSRVMVQLGKMLADRDVGPTLPDRKEAEAQIDMVQKATSLLSVISKELTFELNPAVTEEEAKALLKALHPQVRLLLTLRRQIATRAKARLSGSARQP